MRPPMGAGSNHQANQKGNSLGFVMPLYTVGIVAFFVYTIMKVQLNAYTTDHFIETKKINSDFSSS